MTDDAIAPGKEVILLVEDDESVRHVLCQSLTKKGYSVLEAIHGAEALAAIEGGEAVELVVTDVVMPVMGGFELATRLARSHGGIKVLLMSGYTQSDGGIGGNRILAEGTHFLRKPFSTELLARKVREMFDE